MKIYAKSSSVLSDIPNNNQKTKIMKNRSRTNANKQSAPADSNAGVSTETPAASTPAAMVAPAPAAPASPAAVASPATVAAPAPVLAPAAPVEAHTNGVPANMAPVNVPVVIENGRIAQISANPQTQAEIDELNRRYSELEQRTQAEAQAKIDAYIATIDSIPALLGVADLETVVTVIRNRMGNRLTATNGASNGRAASNGSRPDRKWSRYPIDDATIKAVEVDLRAGKMTAKEISEKHGPSAAWVAKHKRDIGLTKKR